jgi:hypothetical protein
VFLSMFEASAGLVPLAPLSAEREARGKADPGRTMESLFATMERLDAGGTKRVRLLAAPRGRLGALGQTGIGERTIGKIVGQQSGKGINESGTDRGRPDYGRPFRKTRPPARCSDIERGSVSGTMSSFKLLHSPRPIAKYWNAARLISSAR